MTAEIPKVRFNGKLVPAPSVWKRLEAASTTADVIERFNERFPHLATARSVDVVRKVRKRLGEIKLVMPKKPEKLDEHADLARDLLGRMPPEDVITRLESEFNQHMSLVQLIALVGEETYTTSLRREAREYEQNRILPEQTAQIWSEMRRPVPGGGMWNAFKVNRLIDG